MGREWVALQDFTGNVTDGLRTVRFSMDDLRGSARVTFRGLQQGINDAVGAFQLLG